MVVFEVVPFAAPAGPTTRHAWETLRDQLLEQLRAAFGPDHDTVGFDDTLREHGERTLLVVSQDSEKHAPPPLLSSQWRQHTISL